MIIGVPKEIKANENRVAITPAGVKALISAGHTVFVQTTAGLGSGISDKEYTDAGAKMLKTPKEIFEKADTIVKVKEPLESEYDLFKEGQVLYTYLHLAAEKPLAEALMKKKVTAIAYETVELGDGSLPLLTPMSEVAGRVATQVGAQMLTKFWGGSGTLLGGVPGVNPGKVVVIGGGIVGLNAARMAMGLGADVTIMDISKKRLIYIDELYSGRMKTLWASSYNIAKAVAECDLLVGAVLIPGAKAPKLVTEEMVKTMKKGSVIVDVAIDQGGMVETIDRVTTHANPCYEKHGVIHYSVANMPGSVPRTSTFALTDVTLKYLLDIANKGAIQAMKEDKALMLGLNVHDGFITYKAVADDLNLAYKSTKDFFGV
ncbi:MAG: alanine dehydrogenase [Firmicutes bacterium]|nr:alanine dehydrogenase [Bacillota bacterium]